MSKYTKKITLESLAATMETGFKRMDKGFKDVYVKMDAGFKDVYVKMDAGFKKAEENRESLARMIANGFEDVMQKMATKDDTAKLEQGQENIQLRVDSLAPNFEVKGLERRVKRLEDKAGIRHTIHSR